jgi:hypothetical protein
MIQSPCWARFKRFGDRWFTFDGKDGTSALDALQLVIDAPEFLGQSSDQHLPRAAMATPQSHSHRVLVVVDDAGGIQLAVCPEPGGDSAVVVGDVVATGHRFWRKKFDALAEPFQEFLGTSLIDWVAGRAGENWSADEFRAGLERSMRGGKFPITIVVNELDPAVKETLDYLREVNQQVRVLGYTCLTSGGDELVWPRELSEEPVVPTPPPARSQPRPTVPLSSPRPQSRPQPTHVQKSSPPADSEPTASAQPQPAEPAAHDAMPGSDATSKQKELLSRLIQLDGLGLVRMGLEYYLAEDELEATATIVLAVDSHRWPFPKPDEVIVVVNTGPAHLGGFLKIAQTDVEEFFSSLPRPEQKEQKGSILLRAANFHEADQVVNELRALKEVTAGGPVGSSR